MPYFLKKPWTINRKNKIKVDISSLIHVCLFADQIERLDTTDRLTTTFVTRCRMTLTNMRKRLIPLTDDRCEQVALAIIKEVRENVLKMVAQLPTI